MIDEARALRAYTDVLAVEYDVEACVMRVVTLGDVYHVIPTEGMHMCADREFNDVAICKHIVASETTRGRIDAPTGWLVTDDLDDRTEAESGGGRARAIADGGESSEDVERFESVCEGCGLNTIVEWDGEEGLCDSCRSKPRTDGGEGQWTVRASNGNERPAESRSEAEEIKADVESLGMDAEILPPDDGGSEPVSDGPVQTVEHVEPDPEPATVEAAAEELPERSVAEDPLDWVPSDFIDVIDSTPTINRKGFEVLAHFYDVDVYADLEVPPEETDFQFCRVKARAVTAGGRECEAYGSAHVDRGDDPELLLEMADTRARKRCLSIATGVGAVAVEELRGELER